MDWLIKMFLTFYWSFMIWVVYWNSSVPAPYLSFPKQEGTTTVNGYCPFRLSGTSYKILAKVLASRLQWNFPSVIFLSQGAFDSGRQILYWVLVANECVDSPYKASERGLICDVDLQKVLTKYFGISCFAFFAGWVLGSSGEIGSRLA